MNRAELERKIYVYKSGDTSAFDFIYENTHKALYFKILYYVRDKMYAEDIMHDAYLKALGAISSYEQNTDFVAWLCRIGKNLALNFLEKRRREVSTEFAEPDEAEVATTEIPYVFEIARKVLSEEEYQIVMLCQVAGYKRREVAKMLSMPIGTVTWKNNTALEKLKKYLCEEEKS
ncbi:MAG: RNA polymerase sigma factor [Candidatus Coproplasma sp.]